MRPSPPRGRPPVRGWGDLRFSQMGILPKKEANILTGGGFREGAEPPPDTILCKEGWFNLGI